MRLAIALAGALFSLSLVGQHQHMEHHDAAAAQGPGDGSAHDASREGTPGVAAGVAAPLELSRAWVRAMPPGRNMTAAYLTITNPTDSSIFVRGVQASVGDASLHENRRVDGQVQMRALAELRLPAHGKVALEPGGLHIMIMDLDRTPAEGEQLRLCLVSTAGTVCADAPVLRRAPDATTSSDADAVHRH
jgi:copper(I)-binding protein